MICKRNWKRTLLMAFSLLFLIAGCGGQQAKQDSQEAPQPQDPPLAKKYVNIVIPDITSTPEVKKDYPDALDECRSSLVRTLKDQKMFKNVTQAKSGKKYPAGSLLVQANVSDMRIVHGAARFWGGAFAGSSYMNMGVKLIDAATGKVVREKTISSANNAWAAAWVGGSSDRTLPADMGKMVAGYIASIIPK